MKSLSQGYPASVITTAVHVCHIPNDILSSMVCPPSKGPQRHER